MAGRLDDAEFWLPSKFLMEDEVVVEKKENLKSKNGGVNNSELLLPSLDDGFPTEFPYEFDSLDSFVDPVVGSTETESSDEDEFLAGLTRRLAHSTSQKLAVPCLSLENNMKSGALATSPQSTLSGLGSWSTSSNSSPNGPSQVPSPPTTPFNAQNDTWDLIYAAAGQVARLKMSSEAPKYTNFNHGIALPKVQSHAIMKNPNPGLYSTQNPHNLSQTNQYHHGRQVKTSSWQAQLQQHLQHQQIQNRTRNHNVVGGRSMGLPQSSWPQLQVQQKTQHNSGSGSGTRAMFLGGSGGIKRESAGTGVFLPRRYGNNPPEPRKKSGSTVLLPAKVVQALNLSFDDTHGHVQPHFNPSFTPNYDIMVARRNAILTQARRNFRPEGSINHEIRLPQEWTY